MAASFFCKVKQAEADSGYDLQPDLKENDELVKIDVSEADMKKLRSGELIDDLLAKVTNSEEGNGSEGGRKSLFKGKLLRKRHG